MPPQQNKQTTNLNLPEQSRYIRPSLTLPKKPSSRRSVITLVIVLIVWLGLIWLIFANRQAISDWWRLRGYHPPTIVQQLADQDTMNSYTRHLFYLNRPQLLSTVTSFRKYCPENKDTIVLGCYHPGQNGIFIYNVQDPALSGVQQVTAAHEVLHAIYARLNSKERSYVDGLLNNYYKNGLTDSRVKEEIKLYQQTEPGSVSDEMNSTFGTEIAKLPTPLESYYRQYFTNRAVIVGYEQRYEAEFTSRQSIVAGDDQQLATMNAQINAQQSALSTQLSQIDTEESHLNTLRSSGQIVGYNSAVPAFNAQVDSYNNGVSALKVLINQYNQLVTARNVIAGEINTLDKALDTRVTQQITQ